MMTTFFFGRSRGFLPSFVCAALYGRCALTALAQKPVPPQPNDAEYTEEDQGVSLRIRDSTSELVDHLPASTKIPTPLKFHRRKMPGQPGELYYSGGDQQVLTRSWRRTFAASQVLDSAA